MPAWTSEENERLLVAIIKTAQPKIDHAAVAADMGETRTVYAVQHQIRKLQKLAANDNPCNMETAKASKKATPKRKKEGTRLGGSGGRKKSEGGISDYESEESPTKKQKVKPEPELEDPEKVEVVVLVEK